MEYISAEEFLKQDKEVQEVFWDWWKPTLGDLYARKNTKGLPYLVWKYEDECILSSINVVWEEKSKCIPLLTEGHLRRFIEDKTGYTIDLCYYEGTYDIELCENDNGLCVEVIREVGKNLLQAYWKVACEIAKEC